jgi:hypothetical protein
MSYVYRSVDVLQGKEKVGDGECVTLIKTYTNAGWTGRWKQGAAVVGNRAIARGTAIANFVNGKWPRLAHGNHSAFYMDQVSLPLRLPDDVRECAVSNRKGEHAGESIIEVARR